MAGWERFGDREWALLGNAPQAAAAAVALASAGGGRREASALVSGWREAARVLGGSPLVAAIAARIDPEQEQQADGRRDYGPPPTFDQLLDEALGLCQGAVAALAAVAEPADVDDYRRFVLYICERVADANNEQGVFGIGGDAMSRDEVSVLRLIARALGHRRPGSSPSGGDPEAGETPLLG
jgi:hypothetical protein